MASFALHGLALSHTTPAKQINAQVAMPNKPVALQFITLASQAAPEPTPVTKKKKESSPQSPKEIEVAPVSKPLPDVEKTSKPVIKKPNPAQAIKQITPLPTKQMTRPPKEKVKETPRPVSKKPEPLKEIVRKKTSERIAQASKTASPVLVKDVRFHVKPKQPTYPRMARRKGLEGSVLIEVWLDKNGRQTLQNIVKSSGHQVLDDAALDAVKQWQFSQHRINGIAIAHRLRVPITFNLK